MMRGHTRLLATQTDERLVELVRQGHERAFEAVVVRYRRALLAYCRRLGLSDPRAEDALQQALLKAWLALQGGAEVRALRPWLYCTVHNTAVNVMRSSKDELPLTPDGALVELLVAPDAELEVASAARQALTHVASLPSMQRDAILMSAVDGRSHDEVARALGISSGAVRGLLYRARTALRAAAATLTPTPLINWASGSAGRAAPTAGRLAELTGATGGADVAGALLKGAALAGSGLLAAGVVLGPLHGRAAPGRGRLALPSAAASGPVEGPATRRHASTTSVSSPALTRVANGTPAGAPVTHTGASPAGSLVTPATGHSGSPAPAVVPAPPDAAGQAPSTSTSAAPATATATAAATTSSTSTGSQPAGGEVAGGSAGGSGGGSSGGSETEGKDSESSSDDGSEGADGGRGDDSGGSDNAEREREAVSERAEQEAEAARERAEREAEIAREQEHERDGGKDS